MRCFVYELQAIKVGDTPPFWQPCFLRFIRHWFGSDILCACYNTGLSELSRSRRLEMPYCIAFGCDNDTHSSTSGVSFHRLPLSKPSLLKQVINVYNDH